MTKPNETFTLSVRDLEIIEEALGAKVSRRSQRMIEAARSPTRLFLTILNLRSPSYAICSGGCGTKKLFTVQRTVLSVEANRHLTIPRSLMGFGNSSQQRVVN